MKMRWYKLSSTTSNLCLKESNLPCQPSCQQPKEGSSPTALIEKHFSSLRDPRAQHSIDHLLLDIIVIILCATICGANDWEAVAEYGRTKYEWLKTFLALPNGIPDHDTFARLFARLNPEELQCCFMPLDASSS